MKAPFSWDPYSDQPYQLKDRAYKKRMRKRELLSLLLTIFSALLIFPLVLLLQFVLPRRHITSEHFFGMSIDLDRAPEQTRALVEELNVNTILIRLPLWEMERLSSYVDLIRVYADKKIILNVMQDREHVEDLELLQRDLRQLFGALKDDVALFQVGSTINRAKWGFFSVHEYLRFYQVAYRLKKEQFPTLKLMGPSVIDFEYHFTIHALFNFFRLKYDALSALLYVDRRGAPENRQMGFDLTRKITLLDAIAFFSPKSARKIYITETNWPISDTAPYAPTSEYECVSEEEYTDYMLRYYLLAFASQRVDAVYWHQLIAPGYGLIDDREKMRRRSAFYAFKVMTAQLQGMEFVRYTVKEGLHALTLKRDDREVTVQWSLTPTQFTPDPDVTCLDLNGTRLDDTTLTLSGSPIYLITKTTTHEQ